jgi:LMBR1 domain-containing protein 1
LGPQPVNPKVGFVMYTVAVASLIGWIFFAFFGGVGLPALPFDLLMEFKHRPRPIRLQE